MLHLVLSVAVAQAQTEPPVDDAEPALEVVVHPDDPDREDPHARTTLDEAALERAAGGDLAETVSQVPGVTLARGTADAAKPMVRGHSERRLLVLHDGVRHESQKWGPDHATEIDPFLAGEIAVIRGAAGSRYGPDAIGGVLLVSPAPMRDRPGIGGKALGSFSTNGLRGFGGLRLDAVPEALPELSVRLEGDVARGASPHTPDYVLGNTASAQSALGAALAYTRGDTEVRLTWRRYGLKAGVFYGVRTATPDEFRAQLSADRPVSADLWKTTYAIDRAYQQVTHDQLTARAQTALGSVGTIAAIYAFQLNDRKEYEQAREAITGPQYDFSLTTHSLDVLASHHAWRLGPTRVRGGIGVQGTFQENVYRGLPLLPNFRAAGGGVFAFERASLGRVDLDVGARWDGLSRAAYLDRTDAERHGRRGTLDEATCTPTGELTRCPGRWGGGSVSLGALVHVVPESLDLKLEASSASRFPNVDELYLIGTAPSFPVYAYGSPGLGTETTWGGSATASVHLPWLRAEVSGFAQRVDRYVYFAPELDADGQVHVDVTVRGAAPRYSTRPIDAGFVGADGAISLGLDGPIGLDVRGSLVRAWESGGPWLVGAPPDRAQVTTIGRAPEGWGLGPAELEVHVDLVARQTRTDPAADFAPTPPGYALLGASISTEIVAGETPLRVGIDAFNLLDARYREVTSLLRYYADQPGRDVRLRIGADF